MNTGKSTTDNTKSMTPWSSQGIGCPNCDNLGWILYSIPANKAPNNFDNTFIYGDKDPSILIDYADKCPVCNGGDAIIENIRKKTDIPKNISGVSLKEFDWNIYGEDVSSQKKDVEKYVDEYEKVMKGLGVGLYLWSETSGSGKTYLASAICNALIDRYRARPRFVNVSQLIDIAKEDNLDEVIRAEVLVLDDVGQKNNVYVNDILYRIVNERNNANRVTISTSNMDFGKLPYDERVVSRFYEKQKAIHMPEFCVRAKEAADRLRRLFA